MRQLSAGNVPYCPSQGISASKQRQYPNHLWSSTTYIDTSKCSGGGLTYHIWYLDGSSMKLGWFCDTTYASTNATAPGYTTFGSVRFRFGFRIKGQNEGVFVFKDTNRFKRLITRRKIAKKICLIIAKLGREKFSVMKKNSSAKWV